MPLGEGRHSYEVFIVMREKYLLGGHLLFFMDFWNLDFTPWIWKKDVNFDVQDSSDAGRACISFLKVARQTLHLLCC